MSELLLPCLDAAGARSVVEVGAFAGDLTRVLVDWAEGTGASVGAIDPAPQPGLTELADGSQRLELIRETSLEALRRIPLPDAIVIDGDHNYFTVSEELRLVGERAAGAELPLLLFHDVCWPHGRRDDYFDPALIPEASRQPWPTATAASFLASEGSCPAASRIRAPPRTRAARATACSRRSRTSSAARERPAPGGRPRLLRLRRRLAPRRALVRARWPSCSTRGTAIRSSSGWRPTACSTSPVCISSGPRRGGSRTSASRQEAVLRRMLESSAFAVAERLSKLRIRAGIAPAQSVVSKDEIRGALENDPGRT